jgi:hypothetical protein
VLWAEPDKHDTLASVTAYHGRKHNHLVVGFRATYLSGVSQVVGDVTGPAYKPVSFRDDDKIMRILILEDRRGLNQIIVSLTTPKPLPD